MATCRRRRRRSGAALWEKCSSDGRVISRDMSPTVQSPQTERINETVLYRLLADHVNPTVAPRSAQRPPNPAARLLNRRSGASLPRAASACRDRGRADQGRKAVRISLPAVSEYGRPATRAAGRWHRRCCNRTADCFEDHFHHVIQTRGTGYPCLNMPWRACRSGACRGRSSASRHARRGPDPGSACRPGSRSRQRSVRR